MTTKDKIQKTKNSNLNYDYYIKNDNKQQQ